MAERQYLIPGVGFISEDTDLREFIIPGSGHLTETSTSAAAGGASTVVFRRPLLGVG